MKVAVVGATGMVGEVMLKVLSERNFPVTELIPVASERSVGKILTYKGRIVFEKLRLPYFDRMPKEYFEKEACFIFVNEGEFSVRSQSEYLNFKKGNKK